MKKLRNVRGFKTRWIRRNAILKQSLLLKNESIRNNVSNSIRQRYFYLKSQICSTLRVAEQLTQDQHYGHLYQHLSLLFLFKCKNFHFKTENKTGVVETISYLYSLWTHMSYDTGERLTQGLAALQHFKNNPPLGHWPHFRSSWELFSCFASCPAQINIWNDFVSTCFLVWWLRQLTCLSFSRTWIMYLRKYNCMRLKGLQIYFVLLRPKYVSYFFVNIQYYDST